MPLRLFHYSDNGFIDTFVPRPVRTPSPRKVGFDWLNGPLVWAIDEWHQPMYLFPRECPRILMWRTKETTTHDIKYFFNDPNARMVAYIEKSWAATLGSESLFRYEFPISSFKTLSDAGMWVSEDSVIPIEKTHIENLPDKLRSANVELRLLDTLTPLRGARNSSLHVSGIRLRNAKNWNG